MVILERNKKTGKSRSWCRCDSCGKDGPRVAGDDFDAAEFAAKRKGWSQKSVPKLTDLVTS